MSVRIDYLPFCDMSTLFPVLPMRRPVAATLAPLVLAGLITGCASVRPQAELPAVVAATPPVPLGPAPLPNVLLTPELLFRIVVAEVAQQRGEPATAYAEYLRVTRLTRDPRMARRAMEVALSARAVREAADAAQAWYQISPNDPEAIQSYASLLLMLGRHDVAQPLLERQLAQAANPIEVLDHLQHILATAPDAARSYILLETLGAPYLAQADKAFDLQMVLARAAQVSGDATRALWHVREAHRLRPDAEVAVIGMAQLLFDTDRRGAGESAGIGAMVQAKADRAEAVQMLETFLVGHPDSSDVRMVYARALVGVGRLSDARAQFEETLRRAPDNPEPLFALGVLELDSEHYDEARGHLDRYLTAISVLPGRDLDLVYLNLARACEGQHQYADAIEWLHRASANPAQAGTRLELEAFALVHLNRTEEALNLLRAMPGDNPEQRQQRLIMLGQVLREAHRHQESYDLLNQGLSVSPDDPALLYETAMSAERLDQLDTMETLLRHLLTLHPDYAHAYNALGYSLADRNLRLPEAVALLEKALSLSPDDGFILDSMGWAQFRLGHLELARDYLLRAFRAKADTDVAIHLSEVLWAQGDKDGARTVLLNAQRKDADSDGLRNALKRLNNQP
jgi:tetratricopeptide (TPR) repeat protein